MTPRLRWYTRLLAVAVLLFCAGLTADSRQILPAHPMTLLPLLALAIVAEALMVAADDNATAHVLSFSATAHIATALLFGPLAAATIAVVAVVAVDGARLVPPYWIALNASMFAASILVACTFYQQLGGRPGTISAGMIPALLALGLTRPIVNAVLYSVGVTLATGTSIRQILVENLVENLSVSASELSLGALIMSEYSAKRWIMLPFLLPLLIAVYRSSSTLERLKRETAAALRGFARVIDQRDPNTASHTERVAAYVEQFVRAIELPGREAERLVAAARYHDLGKVAVDVSTLASNRPLTEEELRAIRSHPRLSARVLAPFHFAREIATYTELHHERYDGTGYYSVPPKEIPIEAHVLIVADSFDAMTSKRAYRPALTIADAAAELRSKAGSQFHPLVARTFAAMVEGDDPHSVLSDVELIQLRGLFAHAPLALPTSHARALLRPTVVACTLTAAALLVAAVGDPLMTIPVGAAAVAADGWALLVTVNAQRRRSGAAGCMDEAGDLDAAMSAAGIDAQVVVLQWDPNTDTYRVARTTADQQDADETARRALRVFADRSVRLESGRCLWISRDEDWDVRLALVSARPLTHVEQQIAEVLADHGRAHMAPIPVATARAQPAHTDENAGGRLLVVKLNGFDSIRGGAGHLVARRVANEAEAAIASVLRGDDTVVRLAEDEVGIRMSNPSAAPHIQQRVSACIANVAVPIRVDRLSPSFSIRDDNPGRLTGRAA
jgi:HD-GYP domain-containing protein (c-di-GMP phosphodiesterase class II)/GGDEF domain-containing protein